MVIHPIMGILGVSLNPNGLMTIPQHSGWKKQSESPSSNCESCHFGVVDEHKSWCVVRVGWISWKSCRTGHHRRCSLVATVNDAPVRFETLAERAEQAPTAMQVNEFVSPHSVVSGSAFGEQFLSPVGEAGARSSSDLWQHQKPQQFCEISSIFDLDNVKKEAILRYLLNFASWQQKKNKAILRDFLQKWKVESTGDGLVPMRFAIFPFHLFKLLRLPGKSDARSYEVLYLSRKIILANLKISCSKMQPFLRNIRPDLLTHPTHVSLALRLPREMHLCRSSSNVPRLPPFWNCYKTLTLCYRPSTVSRW